MTDYFTILNGESRSETFSVSDLPLMIGRGTDKNVVLKDDRVSRAHARIELRGEKVFIVDQGSSNGTFVNESLVSEQELKPGDVIRLGSTRIGFAVAEAGVSPEAETTEMGAMPSADQPDPETVMIPSSAFLESDSSATYTDNSVDAKSGAETIVTSGESAGEADLVEVVSAAVEAAMPTAEKRTVEIHRSFDQSVRNAGVDSNQFYRLVVSLLERCVNAMDHGSGLTLELVPGGGGAAVLSALAEGHVHLPNVVASNPEVKEKEASLAASLGIRLDFPAPEGRGAALFMLTLPPAD